MLMYTREPSNNFCKIVHFLQKKKKVIQEEGGIKCVHKTETEKERGVGEMLTMADKGGRGDRGNADNV